MAKDKSAAAATNGEAATNQASGEVQSNAGASTTPVAAVSDDRYKKVRVPGVNAEGKPDGTFTVKNRKDYILELYQGQKWARGPIARHLTELNKVENGGDGKKIAYQIVFAATKGKPGGPDKPTEGQTVAAPVVAAPASTTA